MKYAAVFEKFDIFNGLDETEKEMLSGFFLEKSFNTDDVIYNEGEDGGSLYFLLDGKVRVCRKNKDGAYLTYAVIKPGETFGLMSFVDGTRHNAATIADKDSKTVKLEKSDFESLFDKDPLIAAKVYKMIGIHLCEIIRDMNKQYMDITQYMYSRSK
jgi:CRP-like cAMP-binding protein